jgi:hypothetical protein
MKQRILKLDTPTVNGRIYPTAEIALALLRISETPVLGIMGVKPVNQVDLADLSHLTSDLNIEDGWLVGEVTVLKTPMGEALGKILDTVAFTPIGNGTVNGNNEVVDYRLLYINAVPKEELE